MLYYLGIDGGGTKTKFTLFNKDLEEISSTTLQTTHIAQVGSEGLRATMQEGIDFFKLQEKPILCVSLAGYGIIKEYCDKINKVFETYFSEYKYMLMSDSVSAYFGARGYEEGAIIIAGTGSIGLSYKDGKLKRVGGFGYVFSDEGSGYYISRLLVQTFLKQSDGRLKKTKLYYHIKEKLSLEDDGDIILYGESRQKTAALSGICYTLAKENDVFALEILRQTAKELSLIANTLAKEFTSINISFIGGITNSFDILMPMIKEYSDKHISYKKPLYSAEKGAVLAYLKRDDT